MNYISKKELELKEVINSLGYNVDDVSLVVSSRKEFGDYQYNGAMSLAKEYHKNPREIATEIANKLSETKGFSNVNIQGPGFINITFTSDSLVEYLKEISNDIKINMNKYEKKKIFLDYGGANVAKILHVGHLRSANIGEALKRLCNLVGYETVSDVHLGDFGRPLALVILEIKKRMPDLVYFSENYDGEYPKESPVTNDDLMEIYPYASAKAKEDEEYLEEARALTVELQKKSNKGYNALLKHIIDTSVKEIKKLYLKLNTTFDLWEGESDCFEYFDEMMEFLEKNNCIEESEGAKVINVIEENEDKPMPPLMLVKSNGSVAYDSTDLAGVWERVKLHNPDEIWYITDKRQSLHFEQVFRASYKTNIAKENMKFSHIGFGTMNGTDGKPFKTRDGGVMTLSNLIEIVREEVNKLTREDLVENREQIVEKITIATLKYADLVPDVSTDYIFDINKFCSMTGKTGPYLLYSTIRMKSLLDKAEITNYNYNNIYNESDKNVILTILEMPKVIDNALKSQSLNDICDYLYRLSNAYNNFYSENRILTENDDEKKQSWISLTNIVYNINKLLLETLGIDIPEKM